MASEDKSDGSASDSSKSDEDECGICLVQPRAGSMRETACGHRFCASCLGTFAMRHQAATPGAPLPCPLCRSPLTGSDIPLSFDLPLAWPMSGTLGIRLEVGAAARGGAAEGDEAFRARARAELLAATLLDGEGLPPSAVERVAPGSAAASAGLRRGMVLEGVRAAGEDDEGEAACLGEPDAHVALPSSPARPEPQPSPSEQHPSSTPLAERDRRGLLLSVQWEGLVRRQAAIAAVPAAAAPAEEVHCSAACWNCCGLTGMLCQRAIAGPGLTAHALPAKMCCALVGAFLWLLLLISAAAVCWNQMLYSGVITPAWQEPGGENETSADAGTLDFELDLSDGVGSTLELSWLLLLVIAGPALLLCWAVGFVALKASADRLRRREPEAWRRVEEGASRLGRTEPGSLEHTAVTHAWVGPCCCGCCLLAAAVNGLLPQVSSRRRALLWACSPLTAAEATV